jgi:hypothetical protein
MIIARAAHPLLDVGKPPAYGPDPDANLAGKGAGLHHSINGGFRAPGLRDDILKPEEAIINLVHANRSFGLPASKKSHIPIQFSIGFPIVRILLA